MSEREEPNRKFVNVPGMSVVVVPTEIAEKIGELVAQVLADTSDDEDDTTAYMLRGVGQIGGGANGLSILQPTITGSATMTTCRIVGFDDAATADVDTPV
jgi:hypothetical protein